MYQIIFLSSKIEWLCMVLWILNLKGYQNPFDFNNVLCPWYIRVFFIWNLSTVDNGELAWEDLWLLVLLRGERYMWRVSWDMWHVTFCKWPLFIFLQKIPEKVTEIARNANNWLKSAKNGRTVSNRRDFIVLVLLSTQGKRVCVSCMRYFVPE